MKRAFGCVFACLALFALPQAVAQVSCGKIDTPVSLRQESAAELLPDIVLTCTGAPAAIPGQAIPAFEVLVSSNAAFTSRALAPLAGQQSNWTEALLLLNEPAPNAQVPCVLSDPIGACPAIAGSPAANVYQGQSLQGNLIAFRNVPIDFSGTNATATLRITNLRVNINSMPAAIRATGPRLTVQIFSPTGDPLAIANNQSSSGTPMTGLNFSTLTSHDQLPANLTPPLIITLSALGPVTSGPVFNQQFHVKFAESFPGAFRRRNAGTSSADPLALVDQSTVGISYNTESGFSNSLFPVTNGLDLAGVADAGTRLKLVLNGIPSGVSVWVSDRDVPLGTSGYSASSPKAILEYNDSTAFGAVTTGLTQGFFELTPAAGTAEAIWEVVSTNPTVAEEFSFAVAVTGSTLGNTNPTLGSATASATLAPGDSDRGDGTPPIPQFVPAAMSVAAFEVVANVAPPALTTVSSASYSVSAIAPDSIASVFGTGLGSPTPMSGSQAGSSTVTILDSNGVSSNPQILSASASQINCVLDAGINPGPAVITVSSGGVTVGSGLVMISHVAPGIFSANASGSGVAAGDVQTINAGQSVLSEMAVFDSKSKTFVSAPIDLGSAGTLVFLDFYGTGFRSRSSISNVQVSLAGLPVPVVFAGAQSEYAGLDQLIAGPVPRSFAGKGTMNVAVTVDGKSANSVSIAFQ